ncbi:Succinyl-CoA ligase [ADP-forming] alpha chain [Desulfurella amilsii]|uniref:Succinyl-CoA ligase [ADP-forming] alpha chain n=1 Tax=Desulfurella amilsii TaxID=1562698 RepID=A0A1X4XUZ1_9BACT|nr:succinate--CoA ligase subunit alpha [Desulfurella amilsii]OSS41356.1 Succinyl-CoA ligase [ADP-forming] alpha chain [Desulfurella amilsii]
MSILIDKSTRAIVQGLGKQGILHTKICLDYGTKIVAGVSLGKTHIDGLDIPVFDCVWEALQYVKADTSLIFVPANNAKDAILEAQDAGIKQTIVITEGIPLQDMLIAKAFATKNGMKIIGPNTPGIISPKQCKLGIMPESIFDKGNIGLISRSGTLMYEIALLLKESSFGVSTALGIGGDPVLGMGFAEVLSLFENDDQTDCVVMIGEIGGTLEVAAIDTIKKMSKKVVAYVAGKAAPKQKKMGHAGAIVSSKDESAQAKIEALSNVCYVAQNPLEIVTLIKKILS